MSVANAKVTERSRFSFFGTPTSTETAQGSSAASPVGAVVAFLIASSAGHRWCCPSLPLNLVSAPSAIW